MSVSDSCPVQVTKADPDRDDENPEAETVLVAYDGLGRRLVREAVEEDYEEDHEDHDEATRIEYLFDGLDPVAEYDVDRGSWRYDDRGALGRIVSSRRGPADPSLGSLSEKHEALALQVWYLYDGLGSVVGLTDGRGRLLERRRYAPYGRLLGEGELHQSPYAFVGKAWEEELGLYYFGVRHYDPGVGVWLTQEPLPGERWRPRTWHRYVYAFANPVNYYDAYGMAVDPGYRGGWGGPVPLPTSQLPVPVPVSTPPYASTPTPTGALCTPLSAPGYSPQAANRQALWILASWFFEVGPEVQWYGPESPFTQILRYHPGVQRVREAWKAAGYPPVFPPRENVNMLLSFAGFGSPTPKGPINPLGGVVGSYGGFWGFGGRMTQHYYWIELIPEQ